jgi:hypothetical protein
MSFPIIMSGKTKMSVSGSKITFSTSTTTIPYVKTPLIQASSELWYKKSKNSKKVFKIAAYKEGTKVSKVEAKGTFSVLQSEYFRVVGHHRLVSPPTYKPSEVEDITYSDWKYVSV